MTEMQWLNLYRALIDRMRPLVQEVANHPDRIHGTPLGQAWHDAANGLAMAQSTANCKEKELTSARLT